MDNIAVSIVVPVYNAERDLDKCLESIRNQTLKNIEIILIDDGSTDSSTEICLNFQKSDSRVIYYRKENEGLAAARQDGMERAHGEFVGFVDSDDWIETEMYEHMYLAAKKEAADVVLCGVYSDETEKNPFYLTPGVYDRKRIEEEILPRSLSGISEKGSNDVIRWSNCIRIYRMSLINENKIAFDRRFRRSQDLQLTFETALVANKYISLGEYLYHNRTEANTQSLSRGYTKQYWALIRPLIDRLYDDVLNYKEQDFCNQMHLCAYFFAVSGIINEFYNSDFNKREKIKRLDEIAKDTVVKSALPHVAKNKLNSFYRGMYSVLHCNDGKSMYKALKKYEFDKNVYKPFVRKLFNNKLIMSINIKLRHKK